ncbi:zf-TFIIB domain-containing protein [Pyrobaculum sp.]|uniref:TFIIB-type zinc ribbon-containing protein n=1 Tax=Pyrobaculum sp. TaxID=2004705 RepID=UPI0031625A34
MKLRPICGIELRPRIVYEIEVDTCPKCGGVWLDGGELNKLLAKVREYHDEYYSYEDYRRWEERYKTERKKRGIFEFFEEIFD